MTINKSNRNNTHIHSHAQFDTKHIPKTHVNHCRNNNNRFSCVIYSIRNMYIYCSYCAICCVSLAKAFCCVFVYTQFSIQYECETFIVRRCINIISNLNHSWFQYLGFIRRWLCCVTSSFSLFLPHSININLTLTPHFHFHGDWISIKCACLTSDALYLLPLFNSVNFVLSSRARFACTKQFKRHTYSRVHHSLEPNKKELRFLAET